MQRFSWKSKQAWIKIEDDEAAFGIGKKTILLPTEIITEPSKSIPNKIKQDVLEEISILVTKGWGDFGLDYIEKNVLGAHLLLILRDLDYKIIGIAPIKKYNIRKREVYSFGLTVVDPRYRDLDLMKKMLLKVTRRILIKRFFAGKMLTEFVFISPNVRTLGAIMRFCDFVYPNPYLVDKKTKSIAVADDETWLTIKEFLHASREKYNYLLREGCIMKGFYDEKPHLLYKEQPLHKKKELNDFAQKYLYSKPGQEVITRAIVNFRKVIRG